MDEIDENIWGIVHKVNLYRCLLQMKRRDIKNLYSYDDTFTSVNKLGFVLKYHEMIRPNTPMKLIRNYIHNRIIKNYSFRGFLKYMRVIEILLDRFNILKDKKNCEAIFYDWCPKLITNIQKNL